MSKVRTSIKYKILIYSLLAGLLFGGVGWGVMKLLNPSLFPLKRVKIFCDYEHVTPMQLKALLLPEVTTGYFSLNLNQLKQKLQSLPWIDEVGIRKIWPDSIEITLFEQKTTVRWGETGLLNQHGQLFLPARNTFPAHLPIIFGPDAERQNILYHFQAFNQQLATIHLKIRSLFLSPNHSWQILLSNGMVLFLGNEDIEMRLARFLSVYPYIIASNSVGEGVLIDLRHKDGFAIRWNKK